MKKVCFIGHRKNCFGLDEKKLEEVIENEIKNGCKTFIMGSHGEFDVSALYTCRKLKKIYKDIEIEVVITSLKKLEKKLLYDDEFGKEYEIPYSDVKTTMYEIENLHFKRRITESNHQMIDSCDTLICYVNNKRYPSGAKHALNYAKRKGLKIINLFVE